MRSEPTSDSDVLCVKGVQKRYGGVEALSHDDNASGLAAPATKHAVQALQSRSARRVASLSSSTFPISQASGPCPLTIGYFNMK